MTELKKHQFICPDCLQPTDKGGSGRRKRCVPCAEKHHRAQMVQYSKDNYTHEYKRGSSISHV